MPRGDDVRHRLSLVPLLLLAIGLAVVVIGSNRIGLIIAGMAGVTAGVMRLLLPPEAIALLVSRRKPVDIAASVVFGAALCIVAFSLPH